MTPLFDGNCRVWPGTTLPRRSGTARRGSASAGGAGDRSVRNACPPRRNAV